MRSAQISQVFIYIMSGIIITAVLGFGVKMLFDVINSSEEVACLKFKDDFNRIVQKDTGYGVVDKLNLNVDCNVREICFIDVDSDVPGDFESRYPLVYDSWNSKVQQNVFFINEVAEDFYYVENLKVKDGYVCKEIDGAGIDITLRGKGKSAELSID